MTSHVAVIDILVRQGFQMAGLTDDVGEAEAVYYKPRAGAPAIYVSVPVNRLQGLPPSVVHRIMGQAGIPFDDYAELLPAGGGPGDTATSA